MGKGTKVAHEGTGSGTGIFYKRWYGKGTVVLTLPIGSPLSSLVVRDLMDDPY